MPMWRNGRRNGLKIRWSASSVWVRVPPSVPYIMSNITYDVKLLGNFHHDIQITKDLKTSDLTPPYNKDIHTYSRHHYLVQLFDKIYKQNLKEKTVLSVACNAGAHLFELQSLGIKNGYGFDVREIWIKQALWLKENIDLYDTTNLNFQCHSLADMPIDKQYDVSFFDGIFYHLADPIYHLQRVADITSEIISINTAYSSSNEHINPSLIYKLEGKKMEQGLSGVEGISWLPNGEQILIELLKNMNFVEFKLIFKDPMHSTRKGVGRLCVLGSKVKGLLSNI